jgi:hypothetical protein
MVLMHNRLALWRIGVLSQERALGYIVAYKRSDIKTDCPAWHMEYGVRRSRPSVRLGACIRSKSSVSGLINYLWNGRLHYVCKLMCVLAGCEIFNTLSYQSKSPPFLTADNRTASLVYPRVYSYGGPQ